MLEGDSQYAQSRTADRVFHATRVRIRPYVLWATGQNHCNDKSCKTIARSLARQGTQCHSMRLGQYPSFW